MNEDDFDRVWDCAAYDVAADNGWSFEVQEEFWDFVAEYAAATAQDTTLRAMLEPATWSHSAYCYHSHCNNVEERSPFGDDDIPF